MILFQWDLFHSCLLDIRLFTTILNATHTGIKNFKYFLDSIRTMVTIPSPPRKGNKVILSKAQTIAVFDTHFFQFSIMFPLSLFWFDLICISQMTRLTVLWICVSKFKIIINCTSSSSAWQDAYDSSVQVCCLWLYDSFSCFQNLKWTLFLSFLEPSLVTICSALMEPFICKWMKGKV